MEEEEEGEVPEVTPESMAVEKEAEGDIEMDADSPPVLISRTKSVSLSATEKEAEGDVKVSTPLA